MEVTLTCIDRSQAQRYLGYGSRTPDDATARRLADCEQALLEMMRPQYMYRVFPLIWDGEQPVLTGCSMPLLGRDIAAHLTGCSHAALLAATLSASVDQCLRQAQATDMTDALLYDALASAAIEQVCDAAAGELHHALPELYQTWRFSPGYGDFPLEVQPMLLAVLDAPKRIGLCATDSLLLTPTKSVTALIGLSETEPPKRLRGCATCSMRDRCAYRGSCAYGAVPEPMKEDAT